MKLVRGRVVRGDGRGRKLGFPTANIVIAASARPPRGVWKVRVSATTLGERLGACNVGVRPTLKGRKCRLHTPLESGRPTIGDRAIRRRRLVVEVHIPRFRGNLYGRTLTLSFVSKIRSERRFPSLGALKAQIRKDVASLTRKSVPLK